MVAGVQYRFKKVCRVNFSHKKSWRYPISNSSLISQNLSWVSITQRAYNYLSSGDLCFLNIKSSLQDINKIKDLEKVHMNVVKKLYLLCCLQWIESNIMLATKINILHWDLDKKHAFVNWHNLVETRLVKGVNLIHIMQRWILQHTEMI